MDIWEKIKGTVGKVLPILGNAIVPGVGGLGGSILADVLGCENTPEAIDAAFAKATPEQIAALRDAEFRHKEELIKLSLEMDRIYLLDVQNARQREIKIVEATGKKDRNLYILAWTVVMSFFVLVGIMMFVDLPDSNLGPVNQLFGAMAAGFGAVLQYFFGSSKGSADKTAMLAGKTEEKK